MSKRNKTKKGSMTLEELARALQADLARMATKDDIAGLATKDDITGLATDVAAVHAEVSNLRDRIEIVKHDLQEQIAGLHYAKEIDELRARVNILEGRLGIKPTRRAA